MINLDELWNFEDFPKLWEDETEDNLYCMNDDAFSFNYNSLENNALEENLLLP